MVGYILVRAVSFILLPLFTNTLTEHEYGIYSVVFIFIAFSQFLYSYGLDASLMKFFVKFKNKRKTVYSSIFVSIFFTSIFLSVFIWLFSDSISLVLLKEHHGLLFKIASCILFLDSFSFRVLVIHRMEGHPFRYLMLTICNVLVTLTSNVYFIYFLQLGVVGALYGTLLGSIITFVVSFPYIISRININYFSYSTLKELLIFGLPFLPSIIFQMIIDFSDRIILTNLTNLELVGIYSAGYKIGGILLLLISGFRLGWEPYFLKLENNKKNSMIISTVTTNVMLLFITIILFTVLFLKPILNISFFGFPLLGKNFLQSINFIPIIMFGYVFLGFYYLQLPGIYYFNKTKYLPVFRGCAAMLNIILNFALIPCFGLFGAAIATALSFLLMSILIFNFTKQFYKINFNWKIIFFYFLFTLIIYVITLNFSIPFIFCVMIMLFGIIYLFYYLKTSLLTFKINDN